MRTTSDREDVGANQTARGNAGICPDCGSLLRSRGGQQATELVCGACGEVQRIEALTPEAAERQKRNLHDRGIDRLRNAVGAWRETP